MEPTLRQLRYLDAVAEHLHFGRAARACHVTQPALSEQIRQLETALGARLIERSQRHVRMTDVGRLVADRARLVLRDVESLVETAHQAQEPFTLPVKLGVIPTIAPYLLPRILPGLQAEYPKLKLYLREEKTDDLLQSLREGKLDAALLALPVANGDFEAVSLFEEDFYLVAPAGMDLGKRQRIGQNELALLPVLLLEEGHCLRDQALEICSRSGVGEEREVRATSLGTLVQMVANGLGVTLLPRMAVEVEVADNPRFQTRQLVRPVPQRQVGLIWRKTTPRRPALERLAEYITHHGPDN